MMSMQTRGEGRRRDDNRIGAVLRGTPEVQTLTPTSGQLRALAAHQEALLERERHRIAQEIHDELGGSLTGIRACLTVAMRRASAARLEPDPLLADASALAMEAMDCAHRIAMDLRPSVLDQLGIWASLEWYTGRLARRAGLSCECSIGEAPSDSELGGKRALMIFRVVQEALTNVERHAQASHVAVRVDSTATTLTVTIADDGVGCEPPREFRTGAMGWFGMVERARQENGTLAITSQPGQGTVLVLSLQLGDGNHD